MKFFVAEQNPTKLVSEVKYQTFQKSTKHDMKKIEGELLQLIIFLKEDRAI